MSGELDNELRADFVVESSDLLQKLGAQLVDLEQRPGDVELLNAIFRGFHTIKGGAGFFDLNGIVELCHAAEDVFNLLRSGGTTVKPELMDIVQFAVDELRTMLDAVATNAEVPLPTAAILEGLHAFAKPPEAKPARKPAARKPAEKKPAEKKPGATPASQVDPFSDDEFEALLDQLHGSGATPGQNSAAVPADS